METIKAKVHLVPTTNAENSILLRLGNYEYERRLMTQSYLEDVNIKSFHMHITSKEVPKIGDFCFYPNLNEVMVFDKHEIFDSSKQEKIIATTDRTLIVKLRNQCDGCIAKLPLENGIHKDSQTFGIACSKNKYRIKTPNPSSSFVEKFCKSNGTIKEILVKYSNGKILVDSHNTISILRIQENHYSYSEVDTILYDGLTDMLENYGNDLSEGEIHTISSDWIQNNLKPK